MKKAFILVLALVLALSLAACGGNENTPSGGNSTTPPTSSSGGTSAPTESTAPGNSSTTAPQGNGEKWPDNDWTKQIPNPAWDSLYKTAEVPDMMFSANYRTVSKEQVSAYVATLKESGYTLNISESDVADANNVSIVKFGGSNEAGYRVAITLNLKSGETTGELLLTVQKAK
jgi:hypothetical protein